MGFIATTSFLLHGRSHFGREGFLRASKQFDNSVMARRLEGKVALVTGANQGLGFKMAEELARRGCTLLMACRSKERGQEAVDKIKSLTGNTDVHLKVCDVSSLQSVAALAKDLEASGQPLHLLINNAGAMASEHKLTPEGLESSYATNTLGGFALTTLLEGVLARSAPARVVFVASGGQYTQPLIVGQSSPKGYDGMVEYARDKRRQTAAVERFAELWAAKNIGVYSMHPGWTVTEGVKSAMPGFFNMFGKGMRELEQGTDTAVWLCLQDQDKLESGAFYFDRAPVTKHFSLAGTKYKKQDVDALWQELSKQTAKATGGASA